MGRPSGVASIVGRRGVYVGEEGASGPGALGADLQDECGEGRGCRYLPQGTESAVSVSGARPRFRAQFELLAAFLRKFLARNHPPHQNPPSP